MKKIEMSDRLMRKSPSMSLLFDQEEPFTFWENVKWVLRFCPKRKPRVTPGIISHMGRKERAKTAEFLLFRDKGLDDEHRIVV